MGSYRKGMKMTSHLAFFAPGLAEIIVILLIGGVMLAAVVAAIVLVICCTGRRRLPVTGPSQPQGQPQQPRPDMGRQGESQGDGISEN